MSAPADLQAASPEKLQPESMVSLPLDVPYIARSKPAIAMTTELVFEALAS
jgi:hypothetical protein